MSGQGFRTVERASADCPEWDLFGGPPPSHEESKVIVIPQKVTSPLLTPHIGVLQAEIGPFTPAVTNFAADAHLPLATAQSVDANACDQGQPNSFDTLIVDPMAPVDGLAERLLRVVRPGGSVFFPDRAERPELPEMHWETKRRPRGEVRRRSTPANTSSTAGGDAVPRDDEAELIDAVSVALTVEERSNGKLDATSHKRAVQALRTHGLCILRGVFDPELVRPFGAAAIGDAEDSMEVLKQTGKDPRVLSALESEKLEPTEGPGGLIRVHGDKMTTRAGLRLQKLATEGKADSLRYHPVVLDILVEASLDPSQHADPTRFDNTMLRRSETVLEAEPVGAVLSLPGGGRVSDQTIHVDTEHLYEHIHLPPHYLAMFLPTMETPEQLAPTVGQTAFVPGSHRTAMARRFTEHGQDATQRTRYRTGLVRPHCSLGDAILFDARILHFGIANASKNITRAILFVNYHRPWFQDVQRGDEIIIRFR